jgi:hypothetical protein
MRNRVEMQTLLLSLPELLRHYHITQRHKKPLKAVVVSRTSRLVLPTTQKLKKLPRAVEVLKSLRLVLPTTQRLKKPLKAAVVLKTKRMN